MYESMIPKADKKLSKESPWIERIKAEDKQKRQFNIRLLSHSHSTSLWPCRWKGMCPSMSTKGHIRIKILLKLS